jgi:hypothetical protein
MVSSEIRGLVYGRLRVCRGGGRKLRGSADESIPASGDRGDIARVRGVIAKRPPVYEDTLRQVRLFDGRVGPDTAHEIVFFNRPAAMLEQDLEHVQRLGRH